MKLQNMVLAFVIGSTTSANAWAQDDGSESADAADDAENVEESDPSESTDAAVDALPNPGSFDLELATIEEEVNSLKERVFRSKATLQLLKEIVVQGSASGSRASIWHVNRLGSGYTIESVAYYLDGQGVFTKSDSSGGLDASQEFKVHDGALPPGTHNLTVSLSLRGSGYGVFSYVEAYDFNVQNSTAFVAEEGKDCQVRTVVSQRKGIGRSFSERPLIEFETRCSALDGDSDE